MTTRRQNIARLHLNNLPPAAFRINIPVMAVRISGRNPYRMSAWWFFPPARFPAIGISIPAVISANPDVIPARADGTMLTNTDRGTELDYDLRMSRYYPKSKTKQRGKNQFSHFFSRGM